MRRAFLWDSSMVLRGAGFPEGPEIVAQGEEEATEAEEEEHTPDRLDLRQVHEEELADHEKERRHAAADERDAVETKPDDETYGIGPRQR